MTPAFLVPVTRVAILVAALSTVSGLHGSSPGPSRDVAVSRGEGEETGSPAAGAGPVFPEHLRQFDIVCDVQGQVSGILNPDHLPSSPAVTGEPWQSVWRESIDLDRMQACWTWCRVDVPAAIAADRERIIFRDEPSHELWVRRSDGAYYRHRDEGGRITNERGICRRAPFTEFPEMEVAERDPEPVPDKPAPAEDDSDFPPRTPGDTTEPLSFPTDWRRFDILCTFPEPLRSGMRTLAVADGFPRGYFKLSIDLEAGWSCPMLCDGGAMDRPITVDADRITFRDRPDVTSWLDRHTGEYHIRREDAGRIEEATGLCVPRPPTRIR